MKKSLPLIIILTLIFTAALAATGFSSVSQRKDREVSLLIEEVNKTNESTGEAITSLENPKDEPGFDAEIPPWEPSEKEEVIYSLLDFSGNPKEVYVVNSFTDSFILDYGRYSEIINMTSSDDIRVTDDRITVSTEEEQLFYQGTLKSLDLPWSIDVAYELNGEVIEAEDLQGRNGEVKITIHVRENDGVDPVFFNYYVMQISLTLDTEIFTEIASPEGVFASAGRNRIINHTILPGNEAAITVKANVRDFSMKSIEFSALPFSMVFDLPLDDDLLDGALTLSDAIQSIHEGVQALNRGIREISVGAQALNEGSAEFGDGLEALSDNSTQIVSSSRQIGDVLKMISDGLNEGAGGIPDFDDFAPLIDVLLLLQEWLELVEEIDSKDLLAGYKIVNERIDEAIASLPQADVDLAPLYEAVEGNDELTESLNLLKDYYESARDARDTYERVRKNLREMEEQLDDIFEAYGFMMEAFPEMIREILEWMQSGGDLGQIGALIDGINQLSPNYERFHSGLQNYMDGVRELSEGQREIQRGYESLADGLGEASDGISVLDKGIGALSEGVGTLPDTIQEEIDKLMVQYDYTGFELVSFVSEKNIHVSLVQFVFKTPEIGAPNEENSVIEEPDPLTFWQRLLSLFGLYKGES